MQREIDYDGVESISNGVFGRIPLMVAHVAIHTDDCGTDRGGCSSWRTIARLDSVRVAVTGAECCVVERAAVSNCPLLADASRLIHPASSESGTRRTSPVRLCCEASLDFATTSVIRCGRRSKSITPRENRLCLTRSVRFQLLSPEKRRASDPPVERIASVDSGFGRLKASLDVDRGSPASNGFPKTRCPRLGERQGVCEGCLVQN